MGGPDSAGGVMILDEVLEHHGIKGMKWGVRRNRSEIDSAPASTDTKTIDSHKETVKSGGTRALQTKELQELVTRMNLEKQYRDLLKNEPDKLKKGQDAAKKVLSLGKTANEIHSFVKSPVGQLLLKAVKG